tara:strand:- start:140 stop:550 length:411 start_codon:yes stop_codon:yes gene_type:complete
MRDTPIGLWWGIDHCRVMKNTFNDTNTQKYIFEMVKHDIGNDKTFVVIDEEGKKSNCFDLNDNFNGFVETENVRLTRKMDRVWNKYLTSKVKVQKSNLNAKDKSKFVDLSRAKYLKQTKLSDKNNTDLENKLKKLS